MKESVDVLTVIHSIQMNETSLFKVNLSIFKYLIKKEGQTFIRNDGQIGTIENIEKYLVRQKCIKKIYRMI